VRNRAYARRALCAVASGLKIDAAEPRLLELRGLTPKIKATLFANSLNSYRHQSTREGVHAVRPIPDAVVAGSKRTVASESHSLPAPALSKVLISDVTKTPMKIEVKTSDKDAVIRLCGRLDMNMSPDLRKAALTLCTKSKCKSLTIECAEVSFIDTSGLATLLEILVATKDRCMQLTLVGLAPNVRYLIDVNGLTGFFTIEPLERERLRA
jgi:anti-anti-sigma factor